VFVVVTVMWCVAMAVVQVVNVVAVLDGFVSAIGAMNMVGMIVGLLAFSHRRHVRSSYAHIAI
jgi:hypothetical protein